MTEARQHDKVLKTVECPEWGLPEPLGSKVGGNALRHFRVTVDYPGARA